MRCLPYHVLTRAVCSMVFGDICLDGEYGGACAGMTYQASSVLLEVLVPLGLMYSIYALVTDAIWGKSMWGTWWIWDARLTSELYLSEYHWVAWDA